MDIDTMLARLKETCDTPNFSRADIKEAMLDILVWLNDPANSADANLEKISYFVLIEIADSEKERLPDDIRLILFDMGAQLDDTFSAPDIAKNFESTPEQLLERVRTL